MNWTRAVAIAALMAAQLVAPSAAGPAAGATPQVECTAVTPLAERPTLAPGDEGSCVRTLKNLLLTKVWSLGYMWPGPTFDAETSTMLADWGRANGRDTVAAVDAETWQAISDSPTISGYTVMRGPNESGKVVLGFDDCPTSLTRFKDAVKAAEKLKIALVLFPTGQCLGSGYFSATYAREHGHYVFNHSVSHKNLTTLSYSKAYAQLGKPGVVTNYGRPPYGAINATVVKAYAARKMNIWTWTYDSQDWKGIARTTVVANVVNNATANTTVLMHMQHKAFNPTGITAIVKGLAARGLHICANYPGTTPRAPLTFRC